MLEFEDELPQPPAPNGAPVKYLKEAAELRENPRRWAILSKARHSRQAASQASNIRRGHLYAFREGKWEAASRTVDGEYRVYVRYIGG